MSAGRPVAVGAVIPSDLYGFAERLTEAERRVLTDLREQLRSTVHPHLNDAWDRAELPTELLEAVRGLELMDPPVLREAGEPVRDILTGFRNFELARCDINVGTLYNAQAGLFRTVCTLGGSPEQARDLDARIRTYELTGVFGLTEPDHGSDVAGGLATTATRDAATGEWVINGAKRWIGGASVSDVVATFARDTADGQVKCFLVPRDAEGVTMTIIPHKASLRIMQNAHIEYRDVRVTEADRLHGINSFKDVARCLRNMRSDVAWMAVGAQAGAYEAALRYVRGREQFGRPIAGFQLVQEKLAIMLGNLTASLGMVVQLTEQQAAGVFKDENSALAKMYTSLRLRETVALAREVCGGNGITLDTDVARFHADAEAIYSYEGTHEINALIVGRAVTGVGAFV
ncbi:MULTISPECIES: acyl-CoA dehydrogenase family protein [Micrococcaceae]|uniref:acyl-CoA dehydrogenase family protein n=1 Tax=Micrococcaceae TaxID=1268 RepID=UPI00160D4495|nr:MULTISPECIES: acyl-CoA dehydrogenase family protein [Micrococcaceae]MBB5750222.1 glutaryl-CoA dehydrogenase [Micrococcus sp. TA1]HRO29855.1 acyl-CoA dehydrogenase family protein [Citricoccus sp.]HRO93757.1 acyl-CoA dehydrogenase family protein [Citricoccus sp.]